MVDDGPVWDFTAGAGAIPTAGGPGWTAAGTEAPASSGPASSAAGPGWHVVETAAPEGRLDAPVGPPVGLLATAGGAAVLALVLALLAGGRPLVAAAGWVLAGFVAVGLLAAFLRVDARRRPSPWYSGSSATGALRGLVLGVAVLGVTANAAAFALWFGRR